MAKMGRPKSENAKKNYVNIRVEDDLYARIRSYAAQHQMHEKIFEDVYYAKERCNALPISGICIVILTLSDGANTSTQMTL